MKYAENSHDLRVRRTHALLWNALMELLAQSGQLFSSITVNDICEKAMVHRTTFYKHFEDKYDLLLFGLSRLYNDLRKHNLQERIIKPFQAFQQNPNKEYFDRIVINQRNDEVFNNYLKNHITKMLKQDFLELDRRGKKFTIPVEIVAEVYSGVIAALSTLWFQNNNITAAELDEYFLQIINKDFFSISQ